MTVRNLVKDKIRMSTFLTNFMRAARSITDAERCIAFDSDMIMQDHLNIDAAELSKKSFSDLVSGWIEEAIAGQKAIIANNLITDPSEAPKTNVHLKDLRMVVAIPIDGYGAIYLDQPIRKGVFERSVVDKIAELAQHISQSGNTDLSEDDMTAMYAKL
jgi:hypothetical protein